MNQSFVANCHRHKTGISCFNPKQRFTLQFPVIQIMVGIGQQILTYHPHFTVSSSPYAFRFLFYVPAGLQRITSLSIIYSHICVGEGWWSEGFIEQKENRVLEESGKMNETAVCRIHLQAPLPLHPLLLPPSFGLTQRHKANFLSR